MAAAGGRERNPRFALLFARERDARDTVEEKERKETVRFALYCAVVVLRKFDVQQGQGQITVCFTRGKPSTGAGSRGTELFSAVKESKKLAPQKRLKFQFFWTSAYLSCSKLQKNWALTMFFSACACRFQFRNKHFLAVANNAILYSKYHGGKSREFLITSGN